MSSTSLSVSGRLGNTPMLREGSSGTKWVRFSLATTASFRDQDGKWRDGETTWFNCKAWGKFAVNIARSLHKGDPVIAQGRLVVGTYNHTDKSTGVMSERADIALHLTHIGIDLLHSSTVNVKYAEGDIASRDIDTELESGQIVEITEDDQTQVPDALVEEIDEVEESSLVETGAGNVPF